MHIDLGMVRLRKPEPSDVDALFAQKNDPEVAALLGGFTKGYSRADIERWIESHSAAKDEALYVIVDREGNCLGHVGLYNIDHRVRSAEFAIMVGDKRAWAKGVGRLCTKWAVDFGFRELALRRIYLNVLESNVRARKLYESLGFVQEGCLRQAQWKAGGWVNVIVMALLAEGATASTAVAAAAPADQREKFWHEWFKKHISTADGRVATWLDYSMDETRGRALQAQTLALVMEAAGPVANLRCLDAGCGWGQLARCLDVQEGRATALDFVEDMIAAGRQKHPSIEWLLGSFLDAGVMDPLGKFDRVFAVEALQCVGPIGGLQSLWERVAPGGRLVAILPNSENPLSKTVAATMPGRYEGLSPSELTKALNGLPDVEFASVRGLAFGEDQRISPYTMTPWTTTPDWSFAPNRLLFVAVRRSV